MRLADEPMASKPKSEPKFLKQIMSPAKFDLSKPAAEGTSQNKTPYRIYLSERLEMRLVYEKLREEEWFQAGWIRPAEHNLTGAISKKFVYTGLIQPNDEEWTVHIVVDREDPEIERGLNTENELEFLTFLAELQESYPLFYDNQSQMSLQRLQICIRDK